MEPLTRRIRLGDFGFFWRASAASIVHRQLRLGPGIAYPRHTLDGVLAIDVIAFPGRVNDGLESRLVLGKGGIEETVAKASLEFGTMPLRTSMRLMMILPVARANFAPGCRKLANH